MQSYRHIRYGVRFSALAWLVMLAWMPCQPAGAMILSRFDPLNPTALYNTTAPADDPGWYNVADNSLAPSPSYLYLGNQWVLTANHVGSVNPLRLANGTFAKIPNSEIRLTNPAGNFQQLDSEGQVINGPLSTHSDLLMFRVNTDAATGLRPEDLNPGIKPISIATTAPTVGTDILMMGIGSERNVNVNDANQQGLFHYQVTTSTNPWQWSGAMDSGGNYHGFTRNNSVRTKRWGTNQVSPDSQLEQPWGINDANNYVVTTVGSGGTDVLTLIAKFDQLGPSSNEAMASAGDSGGPVFFQDDEDQWQLAGIMNAIYFLSGQPGTQFVFGDWTAFADLSQPHYNQQIADLRARSNYSQAGDINLDGIVSGDGRGPAHLDDVTAFVEGWLQQQDVGDILSWKQGDLNQDGITDLADFALLREALGGTIGTAQLESLLAGGGTATVVPEPRSIILAWGILSGLWWLLRRRRLALAPVRSR